MITRRSALTAGLVTLAASRSFPTAAQPRGDAVKIGVLDDMSGVFADLAGPGSMTGAHMAAEDFGGTVLGRPVQIVAGDHQNKPDIAVSIARQWYDVDNIGMITGLTNSGVALAVHKLAAQKRRIDIVVTAATDQLIEEDCSPNGILWNYSARAIVSSTITQAARSAGDTWFFVTSDYAGGHVMEDQAAPLIRAAGGKVLGAVHPPVGTSDYSSFLLQAQASGAKILGVVTYGSDFANLLKQAAEFGITKTMRPVAPFVFHSDLHAVGVAAAQGMIVAAPFYWNLNPATAAWSRRFNAITGREPDMAHAGTYTAVTHYLKSIRAAGTDELGAVLAAMRKMPVEDMYTQGARIRQDGMVVRPIYTFEVKRPAESTGGWDLLRQTGVIDKDVAFALPKDDKCPLLKL